MKLNYKILAFAWSMVAVLSGCSEHDKIATDLTNYAERLESFTELSVEYQGTFDASLNAPAKQTLVAEIEQLTINLREFNAFNGCSLNTIIAERNTALGKMHLPSNRFIYEHKLLNEFERCIELITRSSETGNEKQVPANSIDESEQTIINKLKNWKNIKRQQWPKVWSNLITQSNETYLQFSSAPDYISGQANDNFQSSKQALQYLLKSLDNKTLNISEIEEHLQVLEHSRLMARMFRTQNLLIHELDAISGLLRQYLIINTCATSKQAKEIDIMRNIFSVFFADKIQALGSELNNYQYQLQATLDAFMTSEILPEAFTAYLEFHAQTRHTIYKQSMQAHITLWQEIFARCD